MTCKFHMDRLQHPFDPAALTIFIRSFFLIVFFCLLNMIMAVIMGAYDEVMAASIADVVAVLPCH